MEQISLQFSSLQAPLGEAQQCLKCFSEAGFHSKSTTTTSQEQMRKAQSSLLQCVATTSVFQRSFIAQKAPLEYLESTGFPESYATDCITVQQRIREKSKPIFCADLLEGEILQNNPVIRLHTRFACQ